VIRFNLYAQIKTKGFSFFILLGLLLTSCSPATNQPLNLVPVNETEVIQSELLQEVTPVATRPSYAPGTLVDYIAQSGDSVTSIAAHFNSTEAEIREANPVIPNDATTMPPGFPMKIPIYYEAIWSSSFQILPDIAFVNGLRDVGFDVVSFVNDQPGWLRNSRDAIGLLNRSGGEVVQYVSEHFSISAKMLLAILEYQTGALTNPEPPENLDDYVLGYENRSYQGLSQQLIWTANRLNNGYYGWREGSLDTYTHLDGRLERPDPWQNAASAALQYYFSQVMDRDLYTHAISSVGLLETYTNLFGDPWQGDLTVMPGSFSQPEFSLPFNPGQTWAYTGGPHTAWGQGAPFAAIDFAPGSLVGGCSESDDPAIAIADGVIVRTDTAEAVLDLDGDGDERTGWVIYYLHLRNTALPEVGKQLMQGDIIGYPSCDGGKSTGTHVHIARKYNGEWVLAGGIIPFNLEGWIAGKGITDYLGTLEKDGRVLRACVCSDIESQITAEGLQ
jgi:LasA protease